MPSTTVNTAPVPLRSPFVVVLLGWAVPGAGHLLLGRRGRGAIIFATVLLTFAVGLAMRGPMFQITNAGDVLSRLIQYGGFIGDLASGLIYLVTVWSGYAAPDLAGHQADYGAKLLVAAGLLNILAMVDAYEIATGEKD
ncbi:MAG TPA: DUF6677 family protein [Bryobacteraceae bacterium]|jgi:hypothetical protein|nr:DUF6677 family protein [Bryobacteraceae bacterium]